MSKQRKKLAHLVEKLQAKGSLLSGGFGSIKGGFGILAVNSKCTNPTSCDNTNNPGCTNSGLCGDTTNTGCHNTGLCNI